jgi:urease accessory protein
MHRVTAIKSAGHWDVATAKDRVVLDAGDRRRRRIALTGENGTEFLLDFAKPVALRDGDGLLLDDGAIVAVIGAPEALIEIAAADAAELTRLAWHLGNRHTEVQVIGDRLRIRRDHVLQDMLRGLGATLTLLEAPFDPEGGAHDAPAHGHGHSHAHGHHHHGHGHGHDA